MTILIADPGVTSIPVVDNGEPLVDLATRGIAATGATATGRRVRVGLADRLRIADAALPTGVRLLVVEGHRSAEDQQRVVTAYAGQLRATMPGLDNTELARLTSRYVAPLEVAPHVAGAEVDLTLVDRDGVALWMGTEIDATPEESANACMFAADNIDAIARVNRSLLAEALSGAGLVNYPTEWWHWSYGDRYWAFTTGADHALYGPAEHG